MLRVEALGLILAVGSGHTGSRRNLETRIITKLTPSQSQQSSTVIWATQSYSANKP